MAQWQRMQQQFYLLYQPKTAIAMLLCAPLCSCYMAHVGKHNVRPP